MTTELFTTQIVILGPDPRIHSDEPASGGRSASGMDPRHKAEGDDRQV
jgi:hypothetical protein